MNKHPCCWEFVDRYIYTKVPKRYIIIYFIYTTEFTWIQLIIMLKSWLINSPSASTKPGQKRKAVDEPEECTTPRKFHKVLNQNDFDWYVKDESGIWHCTLCRSAKFRSAYAVGHKEKQKTTNHVRHAKCKCSINLCCLSFKYFTSLFQSNKELSWNLGSVKKIILYFWNIIL